LRRNDCIHALRLSMKMRSRCIVHTIRVSANCVFASSERFDFACSVMIDFELSVRRKRSDSQISGRSGADNVLSGPAAGVADLRCVQLEFEYTVSHMRWRTSGIAFLLRCRYSLMLDLVGYCTIVVLDKREVVVCCFADRFSSESVDAVFTVIEEWASEAMALGQWAKMADGLWAAAADRGAAAVRAQLLPRFAGLLRARAKASHIARPRILASVRLGSSSSRTPLARSRATPPVNRCFDVVERSLASLGRALCSTCYGHTPSSAAMDAIKKKMQAMKIEKDNAMDRADAAEEKVRQMTDKLERVGQNEIACNGVLSMGFAARGGAA
jgi:hypothetical protein